MKWAANNFLWKLLECGIRIYFQPPPFVHSNLLVIDDYYVNIGSTNLDPRGLRLNFELNVEIYDTELAKKITGLPRGDQILQGDPVERSRGPKPAGSDSGCCFLVIFPLPVKIYRE
jgi:hypothetical protein